jgi:cysteinyl-tRNA synthetase
MADRCLGTVDLHGGGIDLLFPHHENELAQTEAYHGEPMRTIFAHNGLVTRTQVKMSKSLGNGVTLAEVLARTRPEALRAFLLSAHYRNPLEFDWDRLAEWERSVGRVAAFYQIVKDSPPVSIPWPSEPLTGLMTFEERFLGALDDDFNTPKAMAEVFDLVRFARPLVDAGGPTGRAAAFLAARVLRAANRILDLLPRDTGAEHGDDDLIQGLIARRERARSSGDYALADALRDTLVEAGWVVQDTPAGTRVVRGG